MSEPPTPRRVIRRQKPKARQTKEGEQSDSPAPPVHDAEARPLMKLDETTGSKPAGRKMRSEDDPLFAWETALTGPPPSAKAGAHPRPDAGPDAKRATVSLAPSDAPVGPLSCDIGPCSRAAADDAPRRASVSAPEANLSSGGAAAAHSSGRSGIGGAAAKKKVYATVLNVREWEFSKLQFGVLHVATVRELMDNVPGSVMCIDCAVPNTQILPGEDSAILADHCYLLVTQGTANYIFHLI